MDHILKHEYRYKQCMRNAKSRNNRTKLSVSLAFPIHLDYLITAGIMSSTYYCSPDLPENEATYAITDGGIADGKE